MSETAADHATPPAATPGLWRRGWTSRCAACAIAPAASGAPLCPPCAADFFAPEASRCERCALRLPEAAHGQVCGGCLRDRPPFDRTVALADYRPPASGMVVALKFGHRLALVRPLVQLLAVRLAAERERSPALLADAVVVPVPLAAARWRERGFNQAAELARPLARRLGLPFDAAALERRRAGPPQEALDRAARQRNVRGAFVADRRLAGRTVLVVDDVMTSGATLAAVAQALKDAGGAAVVNAVIARTP